MLAIEVVVAAKSAGGTYIFDEIDAGVGGQAGFEVGRRLSALAKHSQVIVVTHLAQVAVWADANLVVSKELGSSQVRSVSGPALVQEVARLLSGQSDSERALAHAEELIALARGQ
jgi:DNA repair protein RecN (Recombination protein N)